MCTSRVHCRTHIAWSNPTRRKWHGTRGSHFPSCIPNRTGSTEHRSKNRAFYWRGTRTHRSSCTRHRHHTTLGSTALYTAPRRSSLRTFHSLLCYPKTHSLRCSCRRTAHLSLHRTRGLCISKTGTPRDKSGPSTQRRTRNSSTQPSTPNCRPPRTSCTATRPTSPRTSSCHLRHTDH